MPEEEETDQDDQLRKKLLGLGDTSFRKNYYPELLRRMREVEESRERYRAIFNATADGLIIFSIPEYAIIDVNEPSMQMLGYNEEEMRQQSIASLSENRPPYTFEDAKKILQQVTQHAVQTVEWRARKRDGSLFWAEVRLIHAHIGDEEMIIASLRDIDEHKALEEQLNHSRKLDAMGQLAGGIAHDFNNMIGAILGAAELIQVHAKEQPKISRLSGLILEAATTAGDLTAKLLSFSRKAPLETHPLHMHDAIARAVNILERSLERSITIQLKLDAPSDLVAADVSQIENLVVNMAINARDAMPDGGTLTIASRCVTIPAEEQVEGSQTPSGRYFKLIISDTGVGMSDSTRERIFEPFYTTKETGKGTGLGLAAVYGTVVSHKGMITLESTLGEGTSFDIFLPLLQEKVVEAPAEQTEVVTGKGCVLIIDDEPVVRRMSAAILEDLGYQVLCAEDGVDGVEAFREQQAQIDLVLLDMLMPRMGGEDCFVRLREMNPEIPIIITTGFAGKESIQRLLQEEHCRVIKKPYRAHAIGKVVHELLTGRK